MAADLLIRATSFSLLVKVFRNFEKRRKMGRLCNGVRWDDSARGGLSQFLELLP